VAELTIIYNPAGSLPLKKKPHSPRFEDCAVHFFVFFVYKQALHKLSVLIITLVQKNQSIFKSDSIFSNTGRKKVF